MSFILIIVILIIVHMSDGSPEVFGEVPTFLGILMSSRYYSTDCKGIKKGDWGVGQT
jgi:hypothetical protein